MAEAADLLEVADLVTGCFDKRREPDVGVDFAVDDDPSVVESYGGYRIEPFEGDPHDEELGGCRELWRRWVPARCCLSAGRGILTLGVPVHNLRQNATLAIVAP